MPGKASKMLEKRETRKSYWDRFKGTFKSNVARAGGEDLSEKEAKRRNVGFVGSKK